ncbi:DUF2971 domain-containing protein [Brachyspira pilosicoli]|uniref:DUF2971 domain-containing protein n=1 Tax=Brachyspira pilosicoli TaxID=52584 RepID=UPI002543E724|nr:DUF2971 domain-containing protein [Brachyspira pilosicoli]WIH83375.1 DUF2971 domain-containing protein [Brachyspira pilosicoli]
MDEFLKYEVINHCSRGEFEIAIKKLKDVYELSGELNCYYNIGLIYNDIKDYENAIKYFQLVIKKSEEQNNLKYIANYYNAIAGVYYSSKKDSELALKTYEKALEYANEDELKKDIYFNIVTLYLNENKYDDVINKFNEFIDFFKDKEFDNGIFINMMNVLIYKKNYIDAIECFNKIIEKSKDAFSTFSLFNNIYNMYNQQAFDKKLLNEYVEKIMIFNMENIQNDNVNYLYKYRNFDFGIELLQNEEKIRMSDPKYFNDPADPPIKLDNDLLNNIESIISRVKIASLSGNNKNILMWSHYADSHKGICIEYDFSKITNDDPFKNKICILKKVVYKEYINFINSYFNIKYSPYYENADNRIEKSPPFLYLFYLKYIDWAYEDEYRIISFDYDDDYIYIPIKSVYIGKEVEDDKIERLKCLIREKSINEKKDIKLYKMKSKKENLFELETEEINI